MSCCRCVAAGDSVLFVGDDVVNDVVMCNGKLIGARLSLRQLILSSGGGGEG